MLSQWWMFKNAKYKNLGESLYKKKLAAFVVLDYIIWLIRNIV